VALREEQRFDDLALDYSVGEVLQALSVREARGDMPQWAVSYAQLLATALLLPPDLPPHVVEATAAACQAHGYPLPMVVQALRALMDDTTAAPECGMRTLRGFLEEWRKQLKTRRPMPTFSIRPR
jgi:hypothetical protein